MNRNLNRLDLIKSSLHASIQRKYSGNMLYRYNSKKKSNIYRIFQFPSRALQPGSMPAFYQAALHHLLNSLLSCE